jgi:tetratricopeptide (TPR) repeat protein
MTSTTPHPGDPFSRKALRQALRAWENSVQLGALPLASTQGADRRRRVAGYRDTPAGRGLAARDLVRCALDSLRPAPGDPDPADARWRGFLILTEQYVHGRRPDYLAESLSVARSTFDHEQAAAFERLGAILREWDERGLPADLVGPEARVASYPVPSMAPRMPASPLLGREGLLDLCCERLLGPPRLLVLSGLPGVGKTALAIALSHDRRVREAYPDGVLWAGLGQHPDLEAQLGAWGLALGWRMEELAALPAVEGRARVLQAALQARRLLVVLDDVWALQAASALQLGGPSSAHLITTRSPALAAEIAGEGALAVPELDLPSGRKLLGTYAVELPQDAVDRLVQAVGGLPLALVLMGRHLRQEGRMAQSRRVETALARLQQPSVRMDLTEARPALEAQPSLAMETPVTLRRVIALSDAGLSEDSRQILSALAVFPPKPNTFDEPAALAVSGGGAGGWDALLDAGLVEATGGGRYALHPSVADYAAELGSTETAARNLLLWATTLETARSGDLSQWVADEGNLLAAARLARDFGWRVHLLRFLDHWFESFEVAGRLGALQPFLDSAAELVLSSPDEGSRARVLEMRARAGFLLGNYPAADEDARTSLTLAEAGGDRRGQVACWKILALTAQARGDADEARRASEQGLSLAGGPDMVRERAELTANLGSLAAQRGDTDHARQLYRTALGLARSIGRRRLEITLLANLSVLSAQAGELESAEAGFLEAYELAHADADRGMMASLLINLGALAFDHGETSSSEALFREALELMRAMGDRAGQAHALANLGRLVAARGALGEAEALYDEGLTLARRIGHREHLAQLLVNAGALRRLLGRASEARAMLEEARALATALGHQRFLTAIQREMEMLGK